MKVEVEKVLEKIVEYAVYGLVFSIPFSKAAIEVFGITAIVGWVILRLAVRGAHGTSSDIASSVASLRSQ